MNKFMFFSTKELDSLLTALYAKEENSLTYRTSFHEELEMDVVEVYLNEELQKTIPFTHVLPKIEDRFQITITNYDVTEMNDCVGFVFYMEVIS